MHGLLWNGYEPRRHWCIMGLLKLWQVVKHSLDLQLDSNKMLIGGTSAGANIVRPRENSTESQC